MSRRGGARGWLVGALGAASLACGSDLSVLENGDARPAVQLPPIELSSVVFEGYRGELRDLKVTATSASVDMTTHVAHLRDVAIGFADDPNSQVSISAPEGDFHLEADDFELSGGVQGQTAAREQFASETLSYVAKRRVLVSDTPVELRRANVVLSGAGMELEVPTHKLRLIGNVRAKVKPQ